MHRLSRSILVLAAAVIAVGSACNETPQVTIQSPVHGAFLATPDVTISGRVQPMASGLEVSVNGTVAPLAGDGTWSVTLPLDAGAVVNPFTAVLSRVSNGARLGRARIVVHAGESIADGAFSEAGVGLRINDSGLDQLEPVIESQIDLDLATLLPVNTVIIDNECFWDSIFGCLMRVTVRVANPPPSISGFSFDADSQTNAVVGDIDVFDIRVDLQISGGISCGLRITADATQILGSYELRPDPGDPTLVDVNLQGSPGITFSGFDDEFTSGVCDWFLIGDIIQAVIGDVQPMVLSGLVEFLDDDDGSGPLDSPLADAFEVALGEVSIAGPVGEALQVSLEAPLFDVLEDPAGLTLGSDVRVTSSVGTGPGQCPAPEGSPDLAGSYHVTEPFPAFGANTPGGLPYHIAIAISTSAFNQLLKGQIECGLLRISLTEIDLGFGPLPLTAGVLSILIPELGGFDPETPLEVRLIPTLSPLLTGSAGPGGELGELRVGHYLIEVVRSDVTTNALLLRGALDFRAGLDMAFDDLTGQLVVGIGSVTPQDITVAILTNLVGTNEAQLTLSLPYLIASVLPELGESLGAFPIPGFFGLSLQAVEVSRSGSFYSIFADLMPAP
jgi:hypothetical protein